METDHGTEVVKGDILLFPLQFSWMKVTKVDMRARLLIVTSQLHLA